MQCIRFTLCSVFILVGINNGDDVQDVATWVAEAQELQSKGDSRSWPDVGKAMKIW